jgi:hypothetical protein
LSLLTPTNDVMSFGAQLTSAAARPEEEEEVVVVNELTRDGAQGCRV